MSGGNGEQLVVLCDVDQVVADMFPEWFRRHNNTWDTDISVDDMTDWDATELVEEDLRDQFFEVLTDSTLYQCVKPVDNAGWGVRELRRIGYKVVFVTASNDILAGQKMRWLKKHGFLLKGYPPGREFSDVYIGADKSLLHGHVMIDDAPHNLMTSRAGTRILFDAPWNRSASVREDGRRLGWYRAHGWKAVVDIITREQHAQ